MKYLLYKLVFADPEGASIFHKFKPLLESNANLDDSYEGPAYFWAFNQLGSVDDARLTLLRWEVWSTWKESDNFQMLMPSFIGSSCGIFYYHVDVPETFDTFEEQFNIFVKKQKRDVPIALVIILYDNEKTTKAALKKNETIQKQMETIKKKGADVLFMPQKFADQNPEATFLGFQQYFIKKLNPELASDFDFSTELITLNVDELRYLLIAEKRGWSQKKLDEVLGRDVPTEVGESWDLTAQEKKEEATSADASAPEQEVVEGLEADSVSEKPDLESLKGEKVISPEGEEIVIEEIDEDKLIDYKIKGYKISEKLEAVIPRHCPRCGNHNQRMIFERTDRDYILLDYPRIYGLKTVCGNCGFEWHQK